MNMHALEVLVFYASAILALPVCFMLLGKWSLSRRQAVVAQFLLVVLLTVEYWTLGSSSYGLLMGDEGFVYIPLYLYKKLFLQGQQFAHAIAGGSDVVTMMASGAETLDLEGVLFNALPLWLGIAATKILTAAIAVSGAYGLLRKATACRREVALGGAGAFGASHFDMIANGFQYGIGFAVLPLAAYLLIVRSDKNGLSYWAGAVALAAVNAVSTMPTHAGLALFSGILAISIVLKPASWPRVFGGLALVAAAMAINWHSVFDAQACYGPITSRGVLFSLNPSTQTKSFASDLLRVYLETSRLFVILGVGAIGLLLANRSRRAATCAFAVLATALFGPVAEHLPWASLGLGMLDAIDWFRLILCLPALLLLVAAFASVEAGMLGGRIMGSAILSVAVGQIALAKEITVVNWMGSGGLSAYAKAEVLKDRSWMQKDDLARVVSIHKDFPPPAAASYGLRTFDGNMILTPVERSVFWREMQRGGRTNRQPPYYQTNLTFLLETTNATFDFGCCDHYDIEDWADTDLLRVGGVGYVISAIPLTGAGLSQVAGDTSLYVAGRSRPLRQKIGDAVEKIINGPKLRIYALPRPVPMSYVANSVEVVPAGMPPQDFYARVKANALTGGAVFREEELKRHRANPPAPGRGRAVIAETKDGYDIELNGVSGGMLIVNTLWLPFWQAEADGVQTKTLPVNGIHLAVPLEKGVQQVRLRYNRPLLADQAVERLLGRRSDKITCTDGVPEDSYTLPPELMPTR